MDVRDNQLVLGGLLAEELAGRYATPLYVYEEATLRAQCARLKNAFAATGPQIHYAMKANPNPAILRILLEEGMGIDAVSPHEVRLALEVGFAPERILYTGNNASLEEHRYCLEAGVPVNLGSLAELERWGKLVADQPGPSGLARRVSIRVNPDVGAGHHHHVITGGPHSKFGIYHTQLGQAQTILARHGLTLIGIHSHIGTGILKTQDFLAAMDIVLAAARPFTGLEFIDLGGGLGIPYRPEAQELPLEELGAQMALRWQKFCAERNQAGGAGGREITLKLEPGRFLVAQCGWLLARVTNRQTTPAHTFVGTDSGFNHLIRPTLYGSYHHIVNASRVEGPQAPVVVAGNICESGDVFTQGEHGPEDRPITDPQVGDLLALRDAGAYGMAQASQYNLRPRPPEVLVKDGQARLIRRRDTYEDMLAPYREV